MYARYGELIAERDYDAYLAQLRSLEVVREDSSHTTFGALIDLRPIDIEPFQTYLDGFYDDLDGEVVNVIVHFVPPGFISWVERFRIDGKPVLDTWTTSSRVEHLGRPRRVREARAALQDSGLQRALADSPD